MHKNEACESNIAKKESCESDPIFPENESLVEEVSGRERKRMSKVASTCSVEQAEEAGAFDKNQHVSDTDAASVMDREQDGQSEEEGTEIQSKILGMYHTRSQTNYVKLILK